MNIYAAIQLIGVQNCNDLTKNWILGLGGRLEEKACEPKPKNGLAWLGLGLARAVSTFYIFAEQGSIFDLKVV